MTKSKLELQAQLDILREAYGEMNRLPQLSNKEVLHHMADLVKDELAISAQAEQYEAGSDYTHAALDIFEDKPTFPSIDSLTHLELQNGLDALPELLTWIAKLKAHAINEILNNGETFGYKMRRGAKRQSFKEGVPLEEIAEQAQLPTESMYEQKPVSASKFLKGLTEEQLERVADYIDTKYNEPSLIKIDR